MTILFLTLVFHTRGIPNPIGKTELWRGEGLLMYVNENIPSRLLNEPVIPNVAKIICVEINLRRQKWIILGIYRPPNLREKYFFDNLSRCIDYYSKKYDRIVILGDFNSGPTNEPIETFCSSYNLYNFIKEKTCFKGPPKCYDLILTNYKHNFQNTLVVTTGFSDFHKITVTVLKTEFVKSDPIQINYRDYKNYNSVNFNEDLWNRLNSDISFSKDYSKDYSKE